MAVTEKKNPSILRLKFENGHTEGGSVKYKRKDIKNLKPDATVENVHAVGKTLSNLLEKPANVISKIDDTTYEETL